MGIPNREIGWGQSSILLRDILKELDRLIQVTSTSDINYSFSNGLTALAGAVELGGALTKVTSITGAFPLNINLTGTGEAAQLTIGVNNGYNGISLYTTGASNNIDLYSGTTNINMTAGSNNANIDATNGFVFNGNLFELQGGASSVTTNNSVTTKTFTDGRYYPKTLTANTTITQAGFNTTFSGIGKVTFSPVATRSGLNFGSLAGAPSTLANGDVWYNSSTGTFQFRQNGSTVELGSVETASNGLTKTGSNITLGGAITGDITVGTSTLGGFRYTKSTESPQLFNGNLAGATFTKLSVSDRDITLDIENNGPYVVVQANSGSTQSLVNLTAARSGGNDVSLQILADSNSSNYAINIGSGAASFKGIIYGTDISANFVSGSLINQGYAAATYAPKPTVSINTTAGDSATINQLAGRFRKDTSGSTFALTNSFITSNSIILLTAANSAIDASATNWTVSISGSVATITFNAAPTANFDMNFLVIN